MQHLAVSTKAFEGISGKPMSVGGCEREEGVTCLPAIRIAPDADAAALAQRELTALGPISAKEIIMAVIFVGLLVLWCSVRT
ncbi:anion permease [Cupriavidus necator]|uniref:anion permease n=1 Tax=Cupriavidus necator TaxID=106590 RepID=UPI002786BCA8|nr:hypothetical protein [Cupriavidus necator]